MLRYLAIPLALVVLYLALTFGGRHSGGRVARRAPDYRPVPGMEGTAGVRVLHFYAVPGILNEGEKAVVCYGVVNSKSVRIEPALSGLSPSLNRCLDVAPDQDTKYTLFATGEDGRIASESFVVQVKPDPALQPHVRSFVVARKEVNGGRTLVSLCFEADNASAVSIDPPVVPVIHGPRGCFYVSPERTTTYTATATGHKGRKAQKQVTVQMP